MKTGVAVAAFVAGLVMAPTASAAIVTQLGSTAGYLAVPGETNDVVVSFDHGVAVFEDRGSGAFVVGPGCTEAGSRIARCTGPKTLHVELDDGDDALVANVPLNVVADGGAGGDHIVTGSAADQITGGDGNDVLDGGTEADVLDGGSGDDIVDYAARPKRVIVSL